MTYSPRLLRIKGELPKGKLCPTCAVSVGSSKSELAAHYQEAHKRAPTPAELHRFHLFKRTDLKAKRYPVGIKKDRREISGGLPSLGKKR